MAEEIKKKEEKVKKNKAEAKPEVLELEDKGKGGQNEKIEKKAENEKEEKIAKKKKSKIKRQVQKGQAHVHCSYNNTIVTISDLKGEILGWSSSGLLGFKGAKKSTPYAATQVVGDLSEKVKKYGLQELEVFVKGVGSGREAAVRALVNRGFNLVLIKDVTPIPHNGCRPPKPRRV